MGFQSEAMEEAKEEASWFSGDTSLDVEFSPCGMEVVHVCHVSFVAGQFVILSCVICQLCINGG